ncbi:MAG: hypothetical protein H7288_23840 [Kineosporiaceae bacterium]|nr:hypothetical protein [Aeromicrobium sp.]
MTRLTTNRRKVLIPLATALAAGAIAIGSGASFTSQSTNGSNAYTAGTLTQSNNVTGALFNLINLKPGDQITKTVTIKNTGSLPARFSLTGTATNGFSTNMLSFSIKEGSTSLVTQTSLNATGTVVLPSAASATTPTTTAWASGESHTYTFTVALDYLAPNADQGKSATASFTWDALQENGASFSGQVTDGSSVNTAPGVNDGGSVVRP